MLKEVLDKEEVEELIECLSESVQINIFFARRRNWIDIPLGSNALLRGMEDPEPWNRPQKFLEEYGWGVQNATNEGKE